MSIFEKIASKLSGSARTADGSLPSIENAQDQGLDEQKLVAYVKEKVDQVRQANSRIAIEGVYLTNVAYLMGFDGVYYDTQQRQFRNIDTKRRLTRNRFKVNKILPTCQNRLARITQSPPRYDVRPNSNSTEDKDSARLGLEVITDIFDKQYFSEKRQDLHMSCMQGGHAYVQTLWDPTLGKPMVNPETNALDGYEGDVRLEILNCLEVFPDPLGKNTEDCQFIIKAKVRKLNYFPDTYPERGHLVKEESAWLLSSIYDMKANALTTTGVATASVENQMKNSAIELVYYEKRSKDYPNGRMIVCANGILLEDKEMPISEYDIVKFDDIMIGGRYNSEAVITHLRPIQDQYNISRQKMAEWVRTMLAGKYLAPKGAGISQESINNASAEVIEFNPDINAPAVTALQVPQIPAYAYKELESLDKEFDFISGINEVSRGVLPSASIPAQGMEFLQEQDQTRIGVQTTRNEIGYSKVGCHILKYVGKYYKMPRVLKIAGDGLEYTVKEFMGSDLADNYDVIVIPGSTLPQSKVLRRQDILNAYQMGILGDPMDSKLRAKVLSMLEYGDTAEMWKDQALDEAQTKKLISAIEEGDQETVGKSLSEFDNHQFRLTKMNEYRKGDKFQALDDEKQQMFMWVMEWSLNALTNIQNPALAQQLNMGQIMMNNMQAQAAQGPQMMVPPQGQVDNQGGMQAPPPQQMPMQQQPQVA